MLDFSALKTLKSFLYFYRKKYEKEAAAETIGRRNGMRAVSFLSIGWLIVAL